MLRAVNNLKIKPNILLIDGNQKINSDISQICITKGDNICKSIAAASIIAKVVRDFIVKQMLILKSLDLITLIRLLINGDPG